MTESYHERYAAAGFCNRWARRFVVFGVPLGLAGCSVSMPMAGFVDETPTSAIASKAADAPSTASAKAAKPAVEAAVAQPEL